MSSNLLGIDILVLRIFDPRPIISVVDGEFEEFSLLSPPFELDGIISISLNGVKGVLSSAN